jgi:hypothetical protein
MQNEGITHWSFCSTYASCAARRGRDTSSVAAILEVKWVNVPICVENGIDAVVTAVVAVAVVGVDVALNKQIHANSKKLRNFFISYAIYTYPEWEYVASNRDFT